MSPTILEQHLDALLDADANTRERLLEDLEVSDVTLAARLRRLFTLAHSHDVLPESVETAAPDLLLEWMEASNRDRIGEQVSAYQLVAELGHGGMGVVYQADRCDGEFEQTVAIKFLPRFERSDHAVAMFLEERATLAKLEHPNIARLIDGGISAAGEPYLILELVEGQSLLSWCEGKNQAHRLRLFDALCDAVAYCHRSLVVHGDLKPSNVVVQDDRPRLLDFGVSRLATASPGKIPALGISAGYGAPELTRGEAVSIASDLYALGRVLATVLGRKASRPDLQDDLDRIIQCCSAQDPDDRYDTVAELRADLDAYRSARPISLRRSERGYRFWLFLRRNRLPLLASGLAFASLATGLAVALWQYQIAVQEGTRAKETATFVRSLFDRMDPDVAGTQDVTLRQLMDEAAGRLEGSFAATPAVRYDLMSLIADGYHGIGVHDEALALRQAVFEYYQQTQKPPDRALADAKVALALSLSNASARERAATLLREALATYQALDLGHTLEAGEIEYNLLGQKGYEDPVALHKANEQYHERLMAMRAGDPALVATSLIRLAGSHDAIGNYQEGARLKRQAVELADQIGEGNRPRFITARCNLAVSEIFLQRWQAAVTTGRSCVERRQRRLGASHPELVPALQNIAFAELHLGLLERAQATAEQAVTLARALSPESNFNRLAAEINLANIQWRQGAATESVRGLRSVLTRMTEALGPTHPATIRARSMLGRALLAKGDTAAALAMLRDATTQLQDSPQWQIAGHGWPADAALWLTEAELANGNVEQAKHWLGVALERRPPAADTSAWRRSVTETVASAVHAADVTRSAAD